MTSPITLHHEAKGICTLDAADLPVRTATRWDRKTRSALQLALCVALSAAIPVGNASAQDTIVTLGDSNTSGYGVGTENAFPARLESMLRKRGRSVRVVNAGIPGDTLGGMASRVDSDVPRNAKLVIVQGGYNDLVMGVPPEQSAANMRAILAKLRSRHVNAVLCGFFSKKWDAIGRNLAAKYNAKFVPGSTCYDPKHRGPDGLHMSASGHQVVASRLAGVLQSGTRSANASQRVKHALKVER